MLKKIFRIVSLFITGTVVIFVVWIGFVFFVEPTISDYASRISFESKVWKEAEKNESGIRVTMVDDLLSQHKLVGMSRSKIDELLGTPNKTTYFSDYEYVYWLGPQRSYISIDSEWLGLKFKDNIVIEAQMLAD